MRDHAAEAVAFASGRAAPDLATDRMLQLGLSRLVEIVGEAASRVSEKGQAAIAQLPWPDIIGMRHRIIHGYDQVNLETLWRTVTEDLPPLIAALDEAIARLEAERKP